MHEPACMWRASVIINRHAKTTLSPNRPIDDFQLLMLFMQKLESLQAPLQNTEDTVTPAGNSNKISLK